jgi:hypothetical protein
LDTVLVLLDAVLVTATARRKNKQIVSTDELAVGDYRLGAHSSRLEA